MANYRDIGIADATFIAGVDFSTSQYQFVRCGSVAGEVVLANGNGASGNGPIGVIQNNPCPGQEARVRILGFTKLVCEMTSTCNLLWGRWIVSGSDGQGEPLATEGGSPAFARYMDTTASLVTSGSVVAQVLLTGFAAACATGSAT